MRNSNSPCRLIHGLEKIFQDKYLFEISWMKYSYLLVHLICRGASLVVSSRIRIAVSLVENRSNSSWRSSLYRASSMYESFHLITIITIAPSGECRRIRIHGTFSKTPFDVLALVLTFRLGDACMKCKQQLPCLAEEVYPLVVEKDIHLQFLEPPERHQKIHAVTSKPAD